MFTTLTPFDIYLRALGPVSVCAKNAPTAALNLYLSSFGLTSTPSILEVVADIGEGKLPSAKELALPIERLRELLEYNPVTGILRWKARPEARTEWNNRYAGSVAGTSRDGAIQVRIQNGDQTPFFLAHRIAWALHHGEWPADLIDHENGDPSDNRISNLRPANSSQNNCNRKVVVGASGFRGVYFHAQQQKWAAQIKKDRQWKWLGLHETEIAAARAYDAAAVELHGEFAVTNKSLGLLSDLRPRSMMRSYQKYLSDCIFERPYLLGAAEMSLGKSAATLDGISRLMEANPTWNTLIVGPLEVAKNTWPDEISLWEHLCHLEYVVCCGTAEERKDALDKNCRITIINRENLQWLWETIGGDVGWRWQILVYDESSRLKGFTFRTPNKKKDPKTGQVVRKKPNLTEFGVLAQARKKMERVIELSGTPSPNGVYDLGGQAYLMDQGERLGINKTQFEKRFFDKNPFTHEVKPKEGANDKIMGLMKDCMISLRSQDYIDLPPQMFNPRFVTLSPKHMKQYRDFEKTLVAESYDVEAVSRGVLTNKLLQFANGSLYRTDEDVYPPVRETIHVHDAKIKELESIVEESAGQNVLVAYSFKFDKERIRKKFPKAVFFDEEPNFVKKWNAGKIQMGVSHPASMAHGLNLQYGGFIQVWYGLTWSLELWDQFNRRLARPGQPHPSVFIHVIMAKGTMDEVQYETLRTKGVTQDEIMDAVRVRLIL